MSFLRRRWPVVLVGLAVLAFLLYLIPWVNVRVNWQLDVAQTFIRSRLNPAGSLPPPQIVSSNAAPTAAASPTPRAPTPTAQFTATPLPAAVQLTPAAHEAQGPNNCGPATLAMYFRYYGWEGDQYAVSDEIKPVSADRNVNVDELTYYAGTWAGWLRSMFRVGGTIEMIKEFVAAGIPVMVEKGHIIAIDYFVNDDHWNGHYALVTGYDDAAAEFTFQDSFNGPDQRMGYAEFDAWWQQFNRVYILAFLPHQQETVRGILGSDWDAEVNRQNALAGAQAEVEADTENAYAWFNLGMDQVYFLDYGAAANSFDEARRIGLPMRMLRYQFGPFWAYYNTNRLDDLATLVDYALQITPNSEDVLLWKGWMLLKQNDRNRGIEQFWLAHEANPNSIYVEAAMDSVGVTP
ncbi:MAG TPA: C39 family peptidase [Anaerolineales bacterium]